MPPVTLISQLAGLQHAHAIEVAEARHRLFRRPMAATGHLASRRTGQVIALPTVDVVDRPARVA